MSQALDHQYSVQMALPLRASRTHHFGILMSQIRFLDGLKEIDQKKTRIRNLLTQIFNVYEILYYLQFNNLNCLQFNN